MYKYFFYYERFSRNAYSFLIIAILARALSHDDYGSYQLCITYSTLLVSVLGIPTTIEFLRSSFTSKETLNPTEVLFFRTIIVIPILVIAGFLELYLNDFFWQSVLLACCTTLMMADTAMHSVISEGKNKSVLLILAMIGAISKIFLVLTYGNFFLKVLADAIEAALILFYLTHDKFHIRISDELFRRYLNSFNRDYKTLINNALASAASRADYLIIYYILGNKALGTYALIQTSAGLFHTLNAIFIEKQAIYLYSLSKNKFDLFFSVSSRKILLLSIITSTIFIPTTILLFYIVWSREVISYLEIAIMSTTVLYNTMGSFYSIKINYYQLIKQNTCRLILGMLISVTILFIVNSLNIQNTTFIYTLVAANGLFSNFIIYKILKL